MKFSCRVSDGRCVCASKGQTRVPRLFLQAEMGGGGGVELDRCRRDQYVVKLME